MNSAVTTHPSNMNQISHKLYQTEGNDEAYYYPTPVEFISAIYIAYNHTY